MGLFYPPDSTGENKANAPVSGNTGATYNAVTLLFSFCTFTYHGNTGQHFGDRQPQQKPREKNFDIGAAQGMRQGLKSNAHDDKNNAGQHDFFAFPVPVFFSADQGSVPHHTYEYFYRRFPRRP